MRLVCNILRSAASNMISATEAAQTMSTYSNFVNMSASARQRKNESLESVPDTMFLQILYLVASLLRVSWAVHQYFVDIYSPLCDYFLESSKAEEAINHYLAEDDGSSHEGAVSLEHVLASLRVARGLALELICALGVSGTRFQRATIACENGSRSSLEDGRRNGLLVTSIADVVRAANHNHTAGYEQGQILAGIALASIAATPRGSHSSKFHFQHQGSVLLLSWAAMQHLPSPLRSSVEARENWIRILEVLVGLTRLCRNSSNRQCLVDWIEEQSSSIETQKGTENDNYHFWQNRYRDMGEWGTLKNSSTSTSHVSRVAGSFIQGLERQIQLNFLLDSKDFDRWYSTLVTGSKHYESLPRRNILVVVGLVLRTAEAVLSKAGHEDSPPLWDLAVAAQTRLYAIELCALVSADEDGKGPTLLRAVPNLVADLENLPKVDFMRRLTFAALANAFEVDLLSSGNSPDIPPACPTIIIDVINSVIDSRIFDNFDCKLSLQGGRIAQLEEWICRCSKVAIAETRSGLTDVLPLTEVLQYAREQYQLHKTSALYKDEHDDVTNDVNVMGRLLSQYDGNRGTENALMNTMERIRQKCVDGETCQLYLDLDAVPQIFQIMTKENSSDRLRARAMGLIGSMCEGNPVNALRITHAHNFIGPLLYQVWAHGTKGILDLCDSVHNLSVTTNFAALLPTASEAQPVSEQTDDGPFLLQSLRFVSTILQASWATHAYFGGLYEILGGLFVACNKSLVEFDHIIKSIDGRIKDSGFTGFVQAQFESMQILGQAIFRLWKSLAVSGSPDQLIALRSVFFRVSRSQKQFHESWGPDLALVLGLFTFSLRGQQEDCVNLSKVRRLEFSEKFAAKAHFMPDLVRGAANAFARYVPRQHGATQRPDGKPQTFDMSVVTALISLTRLARDMALRNQLVDLLFTAEVKVSPGETFISNIMHEDLARLPNATEHGDVIMKFLCVALEATNAQLDYLRSNPDFLADSGFSFAEFSRAGLVRLFSVELCALLCSGTMPWPNFTVGIDARGTGLVVATPRLLDGIHLVLRSHPVTSLSLSAVTHALGVDILPPGHDLHIPPYTSSILVDAIKLTWLDLEVPLDLRVGKVAQYEEWVRRCAEFVVDECSWDGEETFGIGKLLSEGDAIKDVGDRAVLFGKSRAPNSKSDSNRMAGSGLEKLATSTMPLKTNNALLLISKEDPEVPVMTSARWDAQKLKLECEWGKGESRPLDMENEGWRCLKK